MASEDGARLVDNGASRVMERGVGKPTPEAPPVASGRKDGCASRHSAVSVIDANPTAIHFDRSPRGSVLNVWPVSTVTAAGTAPPPPSARCPAADSGIPSVRLLFAGTFRSDRPSASPLLPLWFVVRRIAPWQVARNSHLTSIGTTPLTGVTVPRVATVAREGFSSGPAPYPPACWQY